MKSDPNTTPAPEHSGDMDGRELAQIVGVITALAAMTSANPSLIIDKLTGTLWTIKEASELLNAAKLYEPLNDRIIQDLVRRPNTKLGNG